MTGNASTELNGEYATPITLVMDSSALYHLCTKLGVQTNGNGNGNGKRNNYLELLNILAEAPSIEKIVIPSTVADLEALGRITLSLGNGKFDFRVVDPTFAKPGHHNNRLYSDLLEFLSKADRSIIDAKGVVHYIDRQNPKIVIADSELDREYQTKYLEILDAIYAEHGTKYDKIAALKTSYKNGTTDIGERTAEAQAKNLSRDRVLIVTDDWNYSDKYAGEAAEFKIVNSMNLVGAFVAAYGERKLKERLGYASEDVTISTKHYIESTANLRIGLRNGIIFRSHELYDWKNSSPSDTAPNRLLYRTMMMGARHPEKFTLSPAEKIAEPEDSLELPAAPVEVILKEKPSVEITAEEVSPAFREEPEDFPLEEATIEEEVSSEETIQETIPTGRIIKITPEQLQQVRNKKNDIEEPAELPVQERRPRPRRPNIPQVKMELPPKQAREEFTTLSIEPALQEEPMPASEETRARAIDVRETFGYKLGVHRIERNMTEAQLAENVRHLLINPAETTAETVYHWQQSRAVPNAEQLDALVQILITENHNVENKALAELNFRDAYAKSQDALEKGGNVNDPDLFAFSDMLYSYRNQLDLNEQSLAGRLNIHTRIPITECPDSIDARLIYDIGAGVHTPSKGLVLALVKALDSAHELGEEQKKEIFDAFENISSLNGNLPTFTPPLSKDGKAPAFAKQVIEEKETKFSPRKAESARIRMNEVFSETLPGFHVTPLAEEINIKRNHLSMFIGKNAKSLPTVIGNKKLEIIKERLVELLNKNGVSSENLQKFDRAYNMLLKQTGLAKAEAASR